MGYTIKQLVCDIASARIQEIAEITINKNINLKSFLKKNLKIFLKINDEPNQKCFKNIYKNTFSNHNEYDLNFMKNFTDEEIYEDTMKQAALECQPPSCDIEDFTSIEINYLNGQISEAGCPWLKHPETR